MILFSDDSLRNSLFHYAKVECARFKGISSKVFIHRKSITTPISTQAKEAYNFVLRHINQGAKVKGIYTVQRWKYPVKAIREAIRNAVVHRDYSLTGKDVKVAIYDDRVEITSPGLLLPSIDYAAMESRQSDARNQVSAPVFKRLGIIDQWGNGLKLTAGELKEYPDIELRWKEVGLSFPVQFVKTDYLEKQERTENTKQELQKPTLYSEVLRGLPNSTLSRQEISIALGQKQVSGQLNKVIQKLITDRLIEPTFPDKPNHPVRKFRLTERGEIVLSLLDS